MKAKQKLTTLYGCWLGRQGRQSKRWGDNIKEWTGLEFAKSQGAVENSEKWRKLVVKLSVVPQQPSWLRDWWWWWWWLEKTESVLSSVLKRSQTHTWSLHWITTWYYYQHSLPMTKLWPLFFLLICTKVVCSAAGEKWVKPTACVCLYTVEPLMKDHLHHALLLW